MTLFRRRNANSIFVHTLLLVLGVIGAMVAVNVALVVLRPPPRAAPLTAYEIARLLQDREIAKPDASVEIRRATVEPPLVTTEQDRLIGAALAHFLRRPAGDVRFALTNVPPSRARMPRSPFGRGAAGYLRTEYRLYGPDHQFNPMVFGSFTAAVREEDGRWRVASRSRQADPVRSWQSGTLIGILISALLAILVAWLFSKRLARPIRELAEAAGNLGHDTHARPIEVAGPVEVQLAAAALNDMHERIRQYVAERTSAVGALAHDLRTPLSRIHFHLTSATDEVRTKVEAELAEMDAIIATTLDFVQSETRVQPLEPTDLGFLLAGIVDDYADTGRPATLASIERAIINGDPVLLKRLFGNLIENAINYGRNATVTLRIEGKSAIVEVLDEGPGLSAEDRTRAFEPFYRAESSRNRSTGGMGLGLAIARKAAERHDGTVELANRLDKGLCARVRLPLA